MKHLVSIAIGPVQGFIAAGRKTRDLWYGSELLSRASLEAAKVLAKHGTLIFPHESALETNLSIPNKLLAIVGDQPQSISNMAKSAAQCVLTEDWENIRGRVNFAIDGELGDSQIADFFEFYAAWCRFDEQTYADDRRELERLLAGRKALRDFRPAHGRVKQPKSSLEPGLESIVTHRTESARSALKLKPGEELDAVSLTKRLAASRRFVSTARIAIQPFVERVGPEPLASFSEIARTIEKYANTSNLDSPAESFAITDDTGLSQFRAFPFDTNLFWNNGERDLQRLKQKFEEENTVESAAKLGPLEDIMLESMVFYDEAQALRAKLDIHEFPSYLAVLAADGDRMGKALSAMTTVAEHKEFSQRLLLFAADAASIIGNHDGATIYCGGDDVLAFVPVHKAIPCATALRNAFRSVSEHQEDSPISLSVGIAIGHYSEHLQNLLQWARDAEKAAKGFQGGERNALAVSYYPGSGGNNPTTAVSSWNADPSPDSWWDQCVRWHRQDLLPDSAAFDLRSLLDQLDGVGNLTDEQFHKDHPPFPGRDKWSLLELEVDRVLRRKQGERGKTGLSDQMIEALLRRIGNNQRHLKELVNELLIARRIAPVADIAEGALS